MLTRKEFLRLFSAAVASTGVGLPRLTAASKAARDGWYQGDVAHILPTANHHQFLIKTSFRAPLAKTPQLLVNGVAKQGVQTDTRSRFFRFSVAGLSPDTEYELQFMQGSTALCDPWKLKTFPAPDARPERLRILAYTCAGGDESLALPDGEPVFQSLHTRQLLLQRAMQFEPDVVIANGDHIYWDERTMTRRKPEPIIAAWRRIQASIGMMARHEPILGTKNETVLKRVGDRQIADLYGVMFRSKPTFFVTDDHDLFDNDEADEGLKTLPPDAHMLEAARVTQSLYYPEFLPEENRPDDLPGSTDVESESYGTIRFGDLYEGLLFDTKRYVNTSADSGHMVPTEVEGWLLERTKANDSIHLSHVPSTPIGWSAGKWGEWYPDLLQPDGSLGTRKEKPYWPPGWFAQHQRLLAGLIAQEARIPLIMSGDLHMFSAGQITQSAGEDYSNNPVNTVVVGPLGTGDSAYPSAARGVLPQSPSQLTLEELQPPLEKNGFTIIDMDRDRIRFEMYAWRPPEAQADIRNMKPVRRFEIVKDERGSRMRDLK